MKAISTYVCTGCGQRATREITREEWGRDFVSYDLILIAKVDMKRDDFHNCAADKFGIFQYMSTEFDKRGRDENVR
jgi:hypothetical protein